MGQPGQFFGLALEALERLFYLCRRQALHADELDRHVAFQAGVKGAVNRRHAALPERLDDAVPADVLPGEVGHTRSP